MRRYVTSGFMSLQSAVAGYVSGQGPDAEASLVAPALYPPPTRPTPSGRDARSRRGADANANPAQGPGSQPGGGAGAGNAAWDDFEGNSSDPRVRILPAPQPYNIWLGMFPQPAIVTNKFYAAVGPMLGLLLCLSLVFPLAMLIR